MTERTFKVELLVVKIIQRLNLGLLQKLTIRLLHLGFTDLTLRLVWISL